MAPKRVAARVAHIHIEVVKRDFPNGQPAELFRRA